MYLQKKNLNISYLSISDEGYIKPMFNVINIDKIFFIFTKITLEGKT